MRRPTTTIPPSQVSPSTFSVSASLRAWSYGPLRRRYWIIAGEKCHQHTVKQVCCTSESTTSNPGSRAIGAEPVLCFGPGSPTWYCSTHCQHYPIAGPVTFLRTKGTNIPFSRRLQLLQSPCWHRCSYRSPWTQDWDPNFLKVLEAHRSLVHNLEGIFINCCFLSRWPR